MEAVKVDGVRLRSCNRSRFRPGGCRRILVHEAVVSQTIEYDNGRFNADIGSFFDFLRGQEDVMDFARWRRERSAKEEVPIIVKNRVESASPVFIVNTVIPREDIIDGYPTIFTYGKSPFYNESRWFNEGIRRALEMGAKWVVLMSDDLWEITPFRKLTEELTKLDNDEIDTVWIDPAPSFYHSYEAYLAKKHPLENVLGRDHLKLANLCEKFGVETVIGSKVPIRKPLHYYLFNQLFPRPCVGPSFRMTSDFCILSAEWCRRQGPEVLNELYNGFEDIDLSLRLRNARSTTVDWRIGSQIGGTLGIGMSKALRELFNLSIFNSLLREGRY